MISLEYMKCRNDFGISIDNIAGLESNITLILDTGASCSLIALKNIFGYDDNTLSEIAKYLLDKEDRLYKFRV